MALGSVDLNYLVTNWLPFFWWCHNSSIQKWHGCYHLVMGTFAFIAKITVRRRPFFGIQKCEMSCDGCMVVGPFLWRDRYASCLSTYKMLSHHYSLDWAYIQCIVFTIPNCWNPTISPLRLIQFYFAIYSFKWNSNN